MKSDPDSYDEQIERILEVLKTAGVLSKYDPKSNEPPLTCALRGVKGVVEERNEYCKLWSRERADRNRIVGPYMKERDEALEKLDQMKADIAAMGRVLGLALGKKGD